MEFSALQGDIADQSADALVNAAGTTLRMGDGVAGALYEAARGPIEREARRQAPVEVGEVVVTDAYDLDAEYVIHAAAMSHGGPYPRATLPGVRTATSNALATADDLGCTSLVLPLLGCGSGGLYTHEAAPVICETVRAYEPTSLEDVRAIAHTDREADLLADAAE